MDRVPVVCLSHWRSFRSTTTINRHDFGVSWNSALDRGGVVVGNMVEITIDAEAILQEG